MRPGAAHLALVMSTTDIRKVLGPTDQLSAPSSRARPAVLWGSLKRIQVNSVADRQRELYRDAERLRIELFAKQIIAVSRFERAMLSLNTSMANTAPKLKAFSEQLQKLAEEAPR